MANRKTYHYIYKTTCLITGRYYIGMHSTSKINDGYLGSGHKLKYSVAKYGKENHINEILEYLPDRKALAKREHTIINKELLTDPNCMNLTQGGGGWLGFKDEEHQQKCSVVGGKTMTPNKLEILRKNIALLHSSDKHKPWPHAYDWNGKKHKEETKKKMSESKKGYGIGETNSQFGTMWITNGTKNKKIKKEDLIPDGWGRGRKITNK